MAKDNNKKMKILEQSKKFVYPQMFKDWSDTIDKYFSDEEPKKEVYDIINYMTQLDAKTPAAEVAKQAISADYDYDTKLKVVTAVAYFHKNGPDLFREVYKDVMNKTLEDTLQGYEKKHAFFESELTKGK